MADPTLLAPACSWEALEGELAAIGVHPQCWPLPLTLAAVREAEKNPIAQPIPQLPAVKRGVGDGESVVRHGGILPGLGHPRYTTSALQAKPEPASRARSASWRAWRRPLAVAALQGRGRRGGPSVDLDRLTEYELWKHVNEVLNACTLKNGTCERGPWPGPAAAGRQPALLGAAQLPGLRAKARRQLSQAARGRWAPIGCLWS